MRTAASRDAVGQREPLAIELNAGGLALRTALEAAPPLPASDIEDCWACQRRLADTIRDLPPTSRRSERDLGRILNLLDNLPTGKDSAR